MSERRTARPEYLVRTHCPCCGAPAERKGAAVASAPPAETLPLSEHGRFLSGYGARRAFFSYARCPRCTVLFCPVYYTQAQLDALYSRQDENMADVPFAARRKTQERYAAMAMRHLSVDGDFLEIGSDIGLFAAACAPSRRFGRFVLYEPNVEVHPTLASRMAAYPHVIEARHFTPDDVSPGSVSLASLIHVLDHLIDPEAMLAGLHRAMKSGATVFIVTHNVASLLARVLGRRWPPFTLQHPQLFSPTSLTVLLRRAGFIVREIAPTQNDFPLFHLAAAGLSVAGLRNIVPAWQRPTLALRLGNMATIASKP